MVLIILLFNMMPDLDDLCSLLCI